MNSKYLPLLATIVIFVLSYAACALQYPNMLSTRVAGIRTGELHVIDRVWPDNVQTLRSTAGVRVTAGGGAWISSRSMRI